MSVYPNKEAEAFDMAYSGRTYLRPIIYGVEMSILLMLGICNLNIVLKVHNKY